MTALAYAGAPTVPAPGTPTGPTCPSRTAWAPAVNDVPRPL
jgi:hypothetical protein